MRRLANEFLCRNPIGIIVSRPYAPAGAKKEGEGEYVTGVNNHSQQQ